MHLIRKIFGGQLKLELGAIGNLATFGRANLIPWAFSIPIWQKAMGTRLWVSLCIGHCCERCLSILLLLSSSLLLLQFSDPVSIGQNERPSICPISTISCTNYLEYPRGLSTMIYLCVAFKARRREPLWK